MRIHRLVPASDNERRNEEELGNHKPSKPLRSVTRLECSTGASGPSTGAFVSANYETRLYTISGTKLSSVTCRIESAHDFLLATCTEREEQVANSRPLTCRIESVHHFLLAIRTEREEQAAQAGGAG